MSINLGDSLFKRLLSGLVGFLIDKLSHLVYPTGHLFAFCGGGQTSLERKWPLNPVKLLAYF